MAGPGAGEACGGAAWCRDPHPSVSSRTCRGFLVMDQREEHQRPAHLDDATVAALGKLSEALEVVEHARGYLYGFHRL